MTITAVPNKPGSSWEVFSRIAARNVTVDMIVQNDAEETADISFTVPKHELAETLEAVREACDHLDAGEVFYDDGVSKVSAVGLGMATQTGVAEKMFAALAEAGVNIQMITTSEIKISVLVRRDQWQAALRVVHNVFKLEQTPKPSEPTAEQKKQWHNAADVATRLRGIDMEELVVNEISHDDEQASITIVGVPDEPGVAAKVFEGVAKAGVFVDMIIQSYDGKEGEATLTFTAPRTDLPKAIEAAEKLALDMGCKQVVSSPEVSKLSVSGIGLRSHTGVAIRVFRTLANANVNVRMMNTSEVRVNVVVDGQGGKAAEELLQDAFSNASR